MSPKVVKHEIPEKLILGYNRDKVRKWRLIMLCLIKIQTQYRIINLSISSLIPIPLLSLTTLSATKEESGRGVGDSRR